MAGGAGHRAGLCAAGEVALVRALVVCMAAVAGRDGGLNDAVDVELGPGDAAIGGEHLVVAHHAVSGLRVRRGWRKPVAGAARFARGARAGPDSGGAAVAGGGAAARAEVVGGPGACEGSEKEGGAARVVAFVGSGDGHAMAFGAGDRAVGGAGGEMKFMRADAGELGAGVAEDVERGRGAVGGAGFVTVTARAGAVGVDRRLSRHEAAGKEHEKQKAGSPRPRGEGVQR